ncbi:MAG: DUF3422 family protein [wastewater metagenome]|nr:DUF3422 family protein [Candidatus Loosdrechtia aerotolerans]
MNVKVYRISTCHWCDKVESFLKKYSIDYESVVVDVLTGEEQEKAIAEAYHLSKQRSFPVTCIDGICIIGFHESRLKHVLRLPVQEAEKEKGISKEDENKGCGYPLPETKAEEGRKMRDWVLQEAKNQGYEINPDQQLVDDLIQGLIINEKRYGYRACPCRLAAGKYQLDCDIICPCSYCFLDVEKYGRCYCSLFVSDRYLAGDPSLPQYIPDSRERSASMEEIAPVAVITSPVSYKTHIKITGFLQDSTDKTLAKTGFLRIISALNLDVSVVQWHENTAHITTIADDTKITVRVKEDTDIYTYQIACTSLNGKAVNGESIFQRIDTIKQNNRLFECTVIVPDSTDVEQEVHWLLPEKKYISYIYNNSQILAGFETDGAVNDTFIVMSEDDTLDKVIEDIMALEINHYLLALEKQRYILAEDRLNQLDSTLVAKLGTITINLPRALPETLKGWLHGLSNNFGEISGVAEESRHRMNYTLLKRDTIRKIFHDWSENSRDSSFPLLSRFFLEDADNFGDLYHRLFTRINGIRREMMDLITILRTKIDLIVQGQSLELQRSVDETTKTQMVMQHTVEGLSVIVLSYYTVHLAEFIFESLEASHIIHISLATAKIIFVPTAIAFSWFLTFRARRFVQKHSRKSKECDEKNKT